MIGIFSRDLPLSHEVAMEILRHIGTENLLIVIPKSYGTAFRTLVRGTNGLVCQTSRICASSERTSLDAVPSDWEWLTALRTRNRDGH